MTKLLENAKNTTGIISSAVYDDLPIRYKKLFKINKMLHGYADNYKLIDMTPTTPAPTPAPTTPVQTPAPTSTTPAPTPAPAQLINLIQHYLKGKTDNGYQFTYTNIANKYFQARNRDEFNAYNLGRPDIFGDLFYSNGDKLIPN